MNIFNSFRRKARIVYDVVDYNLVVCDETEQFRRAVTGEEMPIHYTVKVQVKCGFIWVTIWSETTNYSDGDSREIINNRAQALCDILQN
ncbi:MAG: hypothetical protein J5957_10015 [Prevotella sp.]|nr:hypothetical protein [Prevotella sp.]